MIGEEHVVVEERQELAAGGFNADVAGGRQSPTPIKVDHVYDESAVSGGVDRRGDIDVGRLVSSYRRACRQWSSGWPQVRLGWASVGCYRRYRYCS